MKRWIMLMLATLMAISLVACGSASDIEGGNATGSVGAVEESQTEEVKETNAEGVVEESQIEDGDVTDPVDSVEESQTADSTGDSVETPDFDTGWAGADYVMYIPQPPFAKYYISYEEGQKLYIISDDSDVELRADYTALADYANILKDAGFTNVEKDMISVDVFQSEIGSIGASTLFVASNAAGYRVMIYQEERLPMVWVYYPN